MKCHSNTNSNGQCDYCGYVDNTIENPCICECHKEAINRPDFTILAGSELTSAQSLELMRRWDNHDALLEACKNAFETLQFHVECDAPVLVALKTAIANAEK